MQLAKMLLKFIVSQLVKYLKDRLQEFASQFVAAAEDSVDGVTIVLSAEVGTVFDLLTGGTIKRIAALRVLVTRGVTGTLSVAVRPGFHR